MRTHSSTVLTVTAIPIERAAYFAFPIPVSEAERVSTPARNTEERVESLRSAERVFLSETVNAGYKNFTMGSEKTASRTEKGKERSTVTPRAYTARSLPSFHLSPAMLLETAGTVAAASP